MKSVGEYLKSVRLQKKFSVAKVEDGTKIKRNFIVAIENNDWTALPDFAVICGFVKNIAGFLGVEEAKATALLRRDYPPKKLAINPKPDVDDKFTWSPKLTFLLGVGVTVVLLLGYLCFQYVKFLTPPSLEVWEPKDSQIVKEYKVSVSGKVDPEATIKINNQPVLIGEDGYFTTEVQIFEGTSEVVVKAQSRSGKETIIRRTIKPELN